MLMKDGCRIPREEVEEIGRAVKRELDVVLPGSEYTICGGCVL